MIADILATEQRASTRAGAPPTRRFRFPGGESVAEQAQRIAAALADVGAGPLPAVVVTHGGTIRAIEGIEQPSGGSVGNCAVFRLTVPSPAPGTRS